MGEGGGLKRKSIVSAERAVVRQHLIDAAVEVIIQRGLTGASTRAIAQQADVALGTLYNHFPDRGALLVAAIQQRVGAAVGELEDLPSRAGKASVASNLRAALWVVTVAQGRMFPVVGAVFADPSLRVQVRDGLVAADHSSPVRARLVAYLAAEQELRRVDADADVDAAAELLLAVCHQAAFSAALLRDEDEDVCMDALGRQVEALVNGLRPQGAVMPG